MKKLSLLAIIFFYGIFVISCGDKSKDDNVTLDPEKPVFADVTPEQSKKDIETSGKNMAGELKSLNQEPGMQASVKAVDLISGSKTMVAKKLKKTNAFKVLSAVKTLKGNNPQMKTVMKAMEDTEDDSILSIEQEFESLKGVYDYDYTKKDFVKVEENESIIINFPSNQAKFDAQINNAQLEFPKPKIKTINNKDIDVSELPEKIELTIKVDGNKAAGYLFEGSYRDDGVPTSLLSQIELGTYKCKLEMTNSDSEISANFSFTHGSTTLIDIGGGVKGDFSESAIQEVMVKKEVVYRDSFCQSWDFNNDTWESVCTEYEYNEYTETTNEFHPDRVLSDANAHFQIMDIKIAGVIDFKNLYPIIEKNKNGEISNEDAVKAINEKMSLVVVYASSNKAIAKAEAYLAETEHTEQVWNDETFQLEEITVKDTTIEFRFIFADDSKIDIKSYFQEGFDGLIDELNNLIDELNATYGWKMDKIDKNGTKEEEPNINN